MQNFLAAHEKVRSRQSTKQAKKVQSETVFAAGSKQGQDFGDRMLSEEEVWRARQHMVKIACQVIVGSDSMKSLEVILASRASNFRSFI